MSEYQNRLNILTTLEQNIHDNKLKLDAIEAVPIDSNMAQRHKKEQEDLKEKHKAEDAELLARQKAEKEEWSKENNHEARELQKKIDFDTETKNLLAEQWGLSPNTGCKKVKGKSKSLAKNHKKSPRGSKKYDIPKRREDSEFYKVIDALFVEKRRKHSYDAEELFNDMKKDGIVVKIGTVRGTCTQGAATGMLIRVKPKKGPYRYYANPDFDYKSTFVEE